MTSTRRTAEPLLELAGLAAEPLERAKPFERRTRLCPRCLMRGKTAALVVGHECACLDATCERCKRPLPVTVVAVDARGSHSERSLCGCFYVPPRTP